MSSQTESAALKTELKELMEKGAISRIKQWLLFSLLSRTEENRRYEADSRSGSLQQIYSEEALPRTCNKACSGVCAPGDWFTSISLKDAYFHVPIIPKHRKFLRFSFNGVQFQYNRLPFGYSLASRTFSKCVETALEPLHRNGIRVLFYLDDLIVMASLRESMALHTVELAKHLSLMGFAINWEKSFPLPLHWIVYLGVQMSSLDMKARLSPARLKALSTPL